ncbi:unnamed protein product [Caenorhabditis brenneri]
MIISDLKGMETSRCHLVLSEKHPDLKSRLEGLETMKRLSARRRSSVPFFYICILCMMLCNAIMILLVRPSTITIAVLLLLVIVGFGLAHWLFRRSIAKYTEEGKKHEANLEKLLRDHSNLEETAQDKNVQAILEEVDYFEKRYSLEKKGRRQEIVVYTYGIVYTPYQLIIHILMLNGVMDRGSGSSIALEFIPQLIYFPSLLFVLFF